MQKYLIKNAIIVNENQQFESDILIENQRISKISKDISEANAKVIDAQGKHLFPGMIDDQVHFREPGLTHKAHIASESRAAVAGGITSFMEMPNTVPNTLTQELLADKYAIGAATSLANYSFFMGASNDNIEEVLKTNTTEVCGIKVFMGSSTGNMLVDNEHTLTQIFSKAPMLVATHCEDEMTIRKNLEHYKNISNNELSIEMHPLIRSAEACYRSSSMAVALAKKHQTRLHILHISTAKELELFDNQTPLAQKKITAEACIHHLWFNAADYARKGNLIKWNPAVKNKSDQEAILEGIWEDKIDIIATDHAPHTWEEKQQNYAQAPSGGPLVQHALPALFDLYHQGKLSLEKIAEKTAHHVAICFQIHKRGFIREGYFADLFLVDLKASQTVAKENILYQCAWSPFEGHTFKSAITHTFVSGNLVFENGNFVSDSKGERLKFDR